MKKTVKRILTLVFVAALFMCINAVTSLAAISAPKTVTVYKPTKSSPSVISFYVNGLGAKQYVNKSSVKVDKTAVATRFSVSNEFSNSKNTVSYYEKGMIDGNNSYSSHSACIQLMAKKTGTVKVSYKIGSKTYTTTVKILAYVNPIKSITLKGVNGGKSFAGWSKITSFSGNSKVKINNTTKNAPLTITAANGWRIKRVQMANFKTGYIKSFACGNKGATSAKVIWPKLTKGQEYSIYLEMENQNTKAGLMVVYEIK